MNMIPLAIVSCNFFPHKFCGFFSSDKTLISCQMFQRLGKSECQNNPLGLSGLWLTLKEFNPIFHTQRVLKIMKEIYLITRESKPHLFWKINSSRNTWTQNYGCLERSLMYFTLKCIVVVCVCVCVCVCVSRNQAKKRKRNQAIY